jgi:peptidoglycan/xylan/chitin deacetylase (PgdA/CDA1 family)
MIFVYHEIVPGECPYTYSTTCQQFEEHLSFLAGLNPAISVTFDDGHASHYLYARELLAKYSVNATFFVSVGFIGSRADHMTWEQVRSLRTAGHSIQSHGWSHKMLTLCSEAQLIEELSRSKRVLEDRLSSTVDALALPNGAATDRVLHACANAGYTRVYNSNPWSRRTEAHGIEVIGRLNVRRTMTPADLERLIRAEQRPLATVRLSYALRRSLRRAIGERLYHFLWCALTKQSVQDEIARSYGAGATERNW